MIPVLALAGAALVLWLSQATIALTGVPGGRIALLPLSLAAAAATIIGVTALTFARRGAASLWPLVLLVLPALAWIPGANHPLLLVWSGGLSLLVWAAVALIMLVSVRQVRTASLRGPLAAGIAAFVIYATAAFHVSPSIPGGDEPH